MQRLYSAGVVALIALISIALIPIANGHQAQALTVTIHTNDIVTVPTSTLEYQGPDFGSGLMHDALGSIENVYRSPWQFTAYEHTFQYTSVFSGTFGYNMTGNGLSFFWGSPDPYNTLTFWTGLNGTGSSVAFGGSAIGSPQAIGHHLVVLLTDFTFRSVTFSSTQPAFEFANLTATPIPGALPLFASVMGLFGLVRWVRRKLSGGQLATA